MSERRAAILAFAGVGLVYLSLSPFTITPMGYAQEEMAACRQILAGAPVAWPRHGGVGLVFECPFVAAGRLVAGPSEWWEARALALQPILASALLVALTFVWCRRLTGSARRGFALALAMGFCTMVWPYAYIGLETTQSLFLFVAAFLALASRAPRTWPRTLLFAACAAVAISAKSNGMMLLPAAAFLALRYFGGAEGRAAARRSKVLAAVALVAGVFLLNAHLRSLYWQGRGGFGETFGALRSPGAVAPLLHLVGFLGSPNKGLVVFAPLALLGLFALPRAFERNRPVATFALLAFGGLAVGCSLLDVWSDETWGPRYLHAAIAPLVLCVAVALPPRPLRLRAAVPLAAAVVLGFGVSLLGVLFHYGKAGHAAVETAPVDLETLQGHPLWNHVQLNARLLGVWLAMREGRAPDPILLEPGHPWDYREPLRVPPRSPVDLRTLAVPQPLVLQSFGPGSVKPAIRPICAVLLVAGAWLLARAWRTTARDNVRPGS